MGRRGILCGRIRLNCIPIRLFGDESLYLRLNETKRRSYESLIGRVFYGIDINKNKMINGLNDIYDNKNGVVDLERSFLLLSLRDKLECENGNGSDNGSSSDNSSSSSSDNSSSSSSDNPSSSNSSSGSGSDNGSGSNPSSNPTSNSNSPTTKNSDSKSKKTTKVCTI